MLDGSCVIIPFLPANLSTAVPQASNLVTDIRSGSFVWGNAYRQKAVVKPEVAVNEFS